MVGSSFLKIIVCRVGDELTARGLDWKSVIAHGMFADGSTSNGTSYGAWTVMNHKVRNIKNSVNSAFN